MPKYTNKSFRVREIADWTCCRNRRCEDCYGRYIVLCDITLYECCTCGELCDDSLESDLGPNTIECGKCIALKDGDSYCYEYQVYEDEDRGIDDTDDVYQLVRVDLKPKAA